MQQGELIGILTRRVQAKALAKDATDGGSLRESASHLPLVLMSEKSSSTDDVWRGIELGAADVLEKPLSSLKLRNIWQHVVRKVSVCIAGAHQTSWTSLVYAII